VRALRIDSHVHAFPERLARAVRQRLNERGGLTASPLLADVAEHVRADGFDAAWILSYAHRAGVAESVNEWSAAEVTQFPWLVAGATFHPDDPDIECLVHRALVELPLRVVKLHCSVGQFSADDARLEPLWRTCAARRIPVVIHEVDAIIPVLEGHPELPLVLAHAGLPTVARTLDLMDRYANLYADVTPVWDRSIPLTPDDLERFAGRILFGSDAPNNPLPAVEQAKAWERSGASQAALAALLGGAAAALLQSVGVDSPAPMRGEH
jgi:uncharacterized protein